MAEAGYDSIPPAPSAIEDRRCVIRCKAASDSEAKRPPITTEGGNLFRLKPASLVGRPAPLALGDRIADELVFAAMQGDPMPAERVPMRKIREALRLRSALA